MTTANFKGTSRVKWLRARFRKQGGRCFYCRCRLVLRTTQRDKAIPPESERDLAIRPHTLDHVVPKAHGGSDGLSNRVLACAPCNADKGDRMPTAEELSALEALNERPWQRQRRAQG